MMKLKNGLQCRNLTYQQRAGIVKHVTANQFNILHEALTKWVTETYALTRTPDCTTMGRILKDKYKFLSLVPQDHSIHRSWTIHSQTLETAFVNWVLQMEHEHRCITGEFIRCNHRLRANS